MMTVERNIVGRSCVKQSNELARSFCASSWPVSLGDQIHVSHPLRETEGAQKLDNNVSMEIISLVSVGGFLY
jgi:hypothetical protein